MFFQAVTSNIREILEQGEPFSTWVGFELEAILNSLAGLAIIAAVVICFFFLLYGGIKWITSAGDKEALMKAQKTVTAALVGLVITFSVWAIIRLVKFFFGIETPLTGGS